MEIRTANAADAEAILEIYAPYVRDTAVSFEYEVPDIEEFRERIRHTLERYPYLVAVEDGKIAGYAYASAFHPRIAYIHSAEVSIYIAADKHRKGIGRALYSALESILSSQNIYKLHSCIAVPDGEDEHLTNDSFLFHGRMGYETSAKHIHCGYKFGKWYSVVWMDKDLKKNVRDVRDFIPFPELKSPSL